eukprot:m51a1_g10268 hypothetical protein (760) ;mRNA; r:32373-35977
MDSAAPGSSTAAPPTSAAPVQAEVEVEEPEPQTPQPPAQQISRPQSTAVPDELSVHVQLDQSPQAVVALTPEYYGEGADDAAFLAHHRESEDQGSRAAPVLPLTFKDEATAQGRLEFIDLSSPEQRLAWSEHMQNRKKKSRNRSKNSPGASSTSPSASDSDYNSSSELLQPHYHRHRTPEPAPEPQRHVLLVLTLPEPTIVSVVLSAIAGNDLLGSILYTAGPCAVACGKLSPIALGIVAIPLFFYRYIYAECVLAIPLNGGVYNILLNSSTKMFAALASVLMLLSYIATAVVSAGTAAQYLCALSANPPITPFWLALLVLAVFATLTVLGVRDSSFVSLTMFLHHIMCIIVGTGTLRANWNHRPIYDNAAEDIWLGFSAAMLGVTGFETSANYIESQGPGVYPKCLRNMWLMSTVQNVVVQFLITALVPYDTMKDMQYDLVAALANATDRHWLVVWLRVNAGIVCCGGVITAFVGTLGLGERLCSDKVLPPILDAKNRLFGTSHWLTAAFWALTSILFAVTKGDLTSMSGMFTAAFLTVLTIVACGNLTLKYKRPKLPRSHRCHWLAVIFGACFIVLALVGNIYMQPVILLFFFVYFTGVFCVVMSVVMRHRLFSMLLHSNFVKMPHFGERLGHKLLKVYDTRHSCAFFTKTASLSELRKACSYVYDNEFPGLLVIIFMNKPGQAPPVYMKPMLKVIDDMYPRMVITMLFVQGDINTESVDILSKIMHIPKNFIFVPCPTAEWPLDLGSLGGVRIITQ